LRRSWLQTETAHFGFRQRVSGREDEGKGKALLSSAAAQEVVFPNQLTAWVKLTDLREDFPLGDNGVTEWEVYGNPEKVPGTVVSFPRPVAIRVMPVLSFRRFDSTAFVGERGSVQRRQHALA